MAHRCASMDGSINHFTNIEDIKRSKPILLESFFLMWRSVTLQNGAGDTNHVKVSKSCPFSCYVNHFLNLEFIKCLV